MQAIEIIIEDTVQGIFHWTKGTDRSPSLPPTWKCATGSIWLVIRLFRATPDWVYPIAQQSSGEGVLPFSLLEWLF